MEHGGARPARRGELLAPLRAPRRFALRAAGVLLVAAGIVFALKRAIGRVRPCNAIAGIDALWERPTDPCWRSGLVVIRDVDPPGLQGWRV
jgi:hypothetical protein